MFNCSTLLTSSVDIECVCVFMYFFLKIEESLCVCFDSCRCVCLLLKGTPNSTKTNKEAERRVIEIISSWATGRVENIITLLKTISGPSTALSGRIVRASPITLPDWLPASSCWQSASPISLNDAFSCGLCLASGTEILSVLFLCYMGKQVTF